MTLSSRIASILVAAIAAVAFLNPIVLASDTTTGVAPEQTRVQSQAADSVDLTIYGNRQTQVQETRNIKLRSGQNQIQLEGIATSYRADSLRIVEVTGPGKFSFRSATYQPANLTADRVLAGSVGQTVEVFHQPSFQAVKGKLLAISGSSLILELPSGEVRVLPGTDVRLTSAPAGLSNTASLVVEADAATAGTYKVKFMYEADGLSWSARHNVVFDDASSKVTSWETVVSVVNGSGVAFKNATVRLMSGAAAGSGDEGGREMYRMQAAMADNAGQVESVGDQKSYVLPGQVSLENGQTRQVRLFEAANIPVTRQYVAAAHAGTDRPTSVTVRLVVENCAKHNMGQPLPGGLVKIYQTGASGVQQQTGSARISDKAVDEVFQMNIGTASDIKFTRVLVDQQGAAGTGKASARPAARPAQMQTGQDEPVYEDQTWEVKVFNYKTDREVEVTVEAPLTADDTVKAPFVKKNAGLAEGTLKVDKSSSAELRYTNKIRVR